MHQVSSRYGQAGKFSGTDIAGGSVGSAGCLSADISYNFSCITPLTTLLTFPGALTIRSFISDPTFGTCLIKLNGNTAGGTPIIPTI